MDCADDNAAGMSHKRKSVEMELNPCESTKTSFSTTPPANDDFVAPAQLKPVITPKKLRAKGGRQDFLDNLIGKPVDLIPETKLPTKRLILRRVRYYQQQRSLDPKMNLCRKTIADNIASDIVRIWERASIDCVRYDVVKAKVLKLMEELDSLCKNWSRHKPDRDPLLSFNASLDHMFDVAPSDLEARLRASSKSNPDWEEDWLWYKGMSQVPQVGCMTSRDCVLAARKGRQEARNAEADARANREAVEKEMRYQSVPTSASASPSTEEPGPSGYKWVNRWDDLPSPPPLTSSVDIGGHVLRQADIDFHHESSDWETKTNDLDSTSEDPDFKLPKRYLKEQNKRPSSIILPKASPSGLLRATTAAATRYRISSTAHLAMVASTIKAAGGDVNDFTASPATIKRHRKSEQTDKASEIRSAFKKNWLGWPKVVQWDGKVMEMMEEVGRRYQDINAVVLSIPGSDTTPKVIGIPVVQRGTGINLATSALNKVSEWIDPAELVGGVFDTTASNTGINEGAMSHIEQLQGETLLWLACRHHMAELHLKHPYHLIMHVATGPDDPLFKSFKEWFLEQRANALQNQAIFPDPGMFRKWDWGEADAGSPTGPYLKEENWWARQTLEWVTRELLQNTFPRGDYRELCELINFVLGGEAVRIQAGEVFREFHLQQPGAYHHARFMGKSLYILKLYVLSLAYNRITARQIRALERLVRYIITLYGRYFLTASLSSAAPRHDLQLWYDLQMYRRVDAEVANKALASVKKHLWYLAPELVVLALFDDGLSLDEKGIMAVTLVNTPKPEVFELGKPAQPAFRPVLEKLEDGKPPLAVFITERSWLLFDKARDYLDLTRLPVNNPHLAEAPVIADELAWLKEDPAVWTDYEEYMRLSKWVRQLQVTNDAAERAVKNAQEVADLTRDPAHRENVVLVMNDHRGRMARLRKADLNNA